MARRTALRQILRGDEFKSLIFLRSSLFWQSRAGLRVVLWASLPKYLRLGRFFLSSDLSCDRMRRDELRAPYPAGSYMLCTSLELHDFMALRVWRLGCSRVLCSFE